MKQDLFRGLKNLIKIKTQAIHAKILKINNKNVSVSWEKIASCTLKKILRVLCLSLPLLFGFLHLSWKLAYENSCSY